MTQAHQTEAAGPGLPEGLFVWPLAPCQAVTLAAEAAPRALWVHEGRV